MIAAIPFPQISPEIFSITLFGVEFALRWYALAYIAGILIGWRIVLAAVRRPGLWATQPPMTARQVEDLLTWMIVGIILGGRLGFVLFYRPGYYLSQPGEILKVWQGGMSFHGGFLGVVIAALIFTTRHRIPRLSTGDLLALAVPVGLMLGRIANFINAELWGRPTTLPWGVIFPGPLAQTCDGIVGLCARHPSQLYEAFLEGVILASLLLWLAFRRGALKKPGLIMGTFLAGYGLARVIVEHFRQADDQFISVDNPLGHIIRLGDWGLSMGQLLSLPMIAVGLAFVLYARRKP
ncbi:prolipoprotein diacylglyceryl transferase [Thalassovita sp.]|uniref:prolipoprotein diacylglyceryl transferase n=1 Tax=Thalassovita sp. TaxID=1979401 RepID=UPI0029DE7AF6|nr:prolipoprotein diacylglyceryl transferase [Thalassovita sp.]